MAQSCKKKPSKREAELTRELEVQRAAVAALQGEYDSMYVQGQSLHCQNKCPPSSGKPVAVTITWHQIPDIATKAIAPSISVMVTWQTTSVTTLIVTVSIRMVMIAGEVDVVLVDVVTAKSKRVTIGSGMVTVKFVTVTVYPEVVTTITTKAVANVAVVWTVVQ